MSPENGKFSSGQAYVAFSRVRTLDKLHIRNYTRSQICVSPNAESEMVQLCECALTFAQPDIPRWEGAALVLLHINISNLMSKLSYMMSDNLFKSADIISINETHLSRNDKLFPSMLGLETNYNVFRFDRNKLGGGVALLVKSNLQPVELSVSTDIEVVAVQISCPSPVVVVSIYRPPAMNMGLFVHHLTQTVATFPRTHVCIVGDLNEDILLSDDKTCCSQLTSLGFKQHVQKPTRDSGTLIDHLYTTQNSTVLCDVLDCYYSDHDFIACALNFSNGVTVR